MQRRHNFLDRNALLVDACRQAVDSADLERLKSHGIGSSILGNDPPEWVIKWASLVLNYIEVRLTSSEHQCFTAAACSGAFLVALPGLTLSHCLRKDYAPERASNKQMPHSYKVT